MDGSVLSDIFLEVGLITFGSLKGVLNGKHYDRAMNCHKVMVECLERLLLEQYLAQRGEEELFIGLLYEPTKKALEVIQSLSKEMSMQLLQDENVNT